MKNVILVQRRDPRSDDEDNQIKFLELEELARSNDYRVVGEVIQYRFPDRKCQIGQGKVEELIALIREKAAEKVIFYNQLNSTQIYNISEACQCEVIDKFQLILEIFATRATTNRSKLQVELAQLRYELPKARMLVSLLKKEERPGFMGLGGYEDSYEQDIKKRISRINKELGASLRDDEALRTFRHEKGFSLVALAGYTNAGKSTLFRTLVHEDVPVENMLFTTLLPTTRSLTINKRRMLLTDTVGFIEDLPHWMVDAFRSTLEGVFLADVILLVADISEPAPLIRKKLAVCHDIFWEQLENASIITVLNKADRISEEQVQMRLDQIGYLAPNPVVISAKASFGIDTLKETIFQKLPIWEYLRLSLPMSEEGMSVVSWLFDEGLVHNIDYGDTIVMDIEARHEIISRAESLEQELWDSSSSL
ncbi:MAG: GTPase HflX [Methanosarcinaceae archaeon]|nr:GTPase HflX [Methanosarcinaceae archaeon]